jgi:hypothetical protein
VTRIEARLSELLHDIVPESNGVDFAVVTDRARRLRRREVTMAVLAATAGLAVIVGGAAAIAGSGTTPARGVASLNTLGTDGSPAPIVPSAIVIDSSAQEVFGPPSTSQLLSAPALSDQQAWAMYTTSLGSESTSIPSSEVVLLGSLTLPLHASGELAYGYSGPPTGCRGPSSRLASSGTSRECVRWVFLDADTGHLIDMTDQSLAP